MDRIKRIFRFRNILAFVSVIDLLILLLSYLSPYVHPETSGWIPIFGLSYIFIIISTGILLIIWSIMRSRWAFIFLGSILLGGNLHFRTFAIGSDDDETVKTELKVMSYNVRLFDLYNPSRTEALKTRDAIFQLIQSESPEVVCFQEFYHQDRPSKFVTRDTLKLLLKTPHVHERYLHKVSGRQNFGLAMFSKYPMINVGEVAIGDNEQLFNYCIYADILKNNDTFRVYNVHLQSIKLQQDDYALFDDPNVQANNKSSNYKKLFSKIINAYPERARQSKIVSDHIRTSPHPVIVCGDFNDTPMSYAYNQFGSMLVDAFRNTSFGLGVTYAGKVPAGRIDYIFHSPSLHSKQFKIHKKKLSDHYAISATIFSSSDK